VTILATQRLTKSFGSLKVVDSVDLAVESGEALGVIGPNGAGKTTLFNLVTGALRPDAGEVLLDGRAITRAPPHTRSLAGISRTFQIPHPFAKLTVFENLLVAATHVLQKPEREVAQECADILQRTGLQRVADRLGGSLTLLDRKRLELARALATRPRVLLLDEIAGGLTEGECDALVETIREIKTSGVTIVWIEHVVHALTAVVDRLVVLDFGRKIAEGNPKAVMDSAAVREIYTGIAA
jgi:branched-chain amino acid transport system ATP-binding protein